MIRATHVLSLAVASLWVMAVLADQRHRPRGHVRTGRGGTSGRGRGSGGTRRPRGGTRRRGGRASKSRRRRGRR